MGESFCTKDVYKRQALYRGGIRMDKLTQARARINGIDAQIAPLFEERMRAVEDVIAYKLENGLPVRCV